MATTPIPASPGYGLPTLNFSNPLSGPNLGSWDSFGSFPQSTLSAGGQDLNKVEAQNGFSSQTPTNTINVGGQLQNALGNYQGFANSFGNSPNLGRISLSNNFAGPNAYQNMLHNGIDYFGNLGVSEGLQNINLQRNTQNSQLANQLSRVPGMEGVLAVLQNQNLFKSQLAGNPLISQAQKDTSGRVNDQINLQNQLTQLQNQTSLQQKGFNQQAQLAELQAKLASGQPQQNLLEILTNLQGQNRGVQQNQSQIAARNYK